MYQTVLPPPSTDWVINTTQDQQISSSPSSVNPIDTGFLDVEYKLPSTADSAVINVNKGNIGSFSISNEGIESGNPGAKVGMSGEGDNERFYIGDKNSPHVILGQLFSFLFVLKPFLAT